MTIKTTTTVHHMTTWLAEQVAPQVDAHMNDPRVQLIRRLAAKGPEDLCAPGTLRQVLSVVDIEAMPEEDRMMLLDVLLALMPESQLAAVAARAEAELGRIDAAVAEVPALDLL